MHFHTSIVTYLDNLPQAHATLATFRESDWGSEPAVFVQPPHWPKGKPSASANYKRALVAADQSGAGNVLSETPFVGAARVFGHDSTNQVTSDSQGGGSTFTNDLNGNRTMAGYVTGVANRIGSDGVWSYGYDDEGNVTAKWKAGESWTYEYNHRNQMTEAEQTLGTTVTTYAYGYDVYGNVVAKSVNGTAVAKYAYEITDPSPGFTASVHTLWAEYDGGGTMTARYLTNGEETVARVTAGGAVSWLLADRLGSTRLVTDASGAVVSAVEYTAFGGIASQSGTDAQTGNVLFTGGWYDRDVKLHNMHWRWLADNGQWTSEDPIGFSAGDMNTRRYVGNNATNGVDRNGLDVIWLYQAGNGALGHGHSGVLIGNDSDGWRLYSFYPKSGLEAAGTATFHSKFAVESELRGYNYDKPFKDLDTAKRNTANFTHYIRWTTTGAQDKLALDAAQKWHVGKRKYNLTGSNCMDIAADAIKSAGIKLTVRSAGHSPSTATGILQFLEGYSVATSPEGKSYSEVYYRISSPKATWEYLQNPKNRPVNTHSMGKWVARIPGTDNGYWGTGGEWVDLTPSAKPIPKSITVFDIYDGEIERPIIIKKPVNPRQSWTNDD